MGQLSADWVIRNLEERDYGIDLQVELFDGNNPTGHMALIQVKGTEKSFKDEPRARIPVKTLNYAELFNIPFFLFQTSLVDKKTRFIWLQKFISTELEINNPNWRDRKTLHIEIPEENKLKGNEKKFRGIVELQSHHRDALSFIRLADALRRSLPESLSKERGETTARYCLSDVRELKRLIEFLTKESGAGRSFWNKYLSKVEGVLTKLLANYESFTLSAQDLKVSEEILYALDQTMHSYLIRDHTDRALAYAEKKTKEKFRKESPF